MGVVVFFQQKVIQVHTGKSKFICKFTKSTILKRFLINVFFNENVILDKKNKYYNLIQIIA